MGFRPSQAQQETINDPEIESGHNVLVDNFLNAQCMLRYITALFYKKTSFMD